MKKNILIVDDERLAINYLKENLEELISSSEFIFLNDAKIITHQNPNEALLIVEQEKPAIIFLDIQMPYKTGLELAAEIQAKKEQFGYEPSSKLPAIVFTTAYPNYGYEAFQVQAFDYLLKPVDSEKLKASLYKIQTYLKEEFEGIFQQYITINEQGINQQVPLEDVIYFKAEEKYVLVKTEKKEFLISDSLLNLERQFNHFLKIHRAYLVNSKYIVKFLKRDSSTVVFLKNQEYLPVSRRQKQELQNKLNYELLAKD